MSIIFFIYIEIIIKGKKQNQQEPRVQNRKEDNYVICVFVLLSKNFSDSKIL